MVNLNVHELCTNQLFSLHWVSFERKVDSAQLLKALETKVVDGINKRTLVPCKQRHRFDLGHVHQLGQIA